MPKTRSTTKENKSKAAEQKRKHRSSLTPEKKKEVRDRERAARNLKKKIEKDRAAVSAQKARLDAMKKTTYNKAIEKLKEISEEECIEDDGPEDDNDVEDALLAELKIRFDNWYSKPKFFKKMCRFYPDEFDELFRKILPVLMDTTLRGSQRHNTIYRSHKLDDRIQLFITLYFLKEYTTYTTLTAMFVLHERHLAKYIFRVLKSLERSLAGESRMPDDDEVEELLQKYDETNYVRLKGTIFALDGTEIPIRRPADPVMERSHYSYKKKQHSLNVLAIVERNGIIRWASPPTNMLNDQQAWNTLGIREWFEERPNVGIVADAGFTLNPKNKRPINGATPHKHKRKGIPLSETQAEQNIALSRTRVVVENTFARLKKWKILRGPFRHYIANRVSKISVDLVVACCIGLTNLMLKLTPCRADDWEPSVVTIEDIDRHYRRYRIAPAQDVQSGSE